MALNRQHYFSWHHFTFRLATKCNNSNRTVHIKEIKTNVKPCSSVFLLNKLYSTLECNNFQNRQNLQYFQNKDYNYKNSL